METKIQYKTCTRCKQIKEVSEYYKDKSKNDGLKTQCKLCCSEYNKNYKKENRERISEYNKKYEKENRERRNEYRVAYNSIEKNRIAHAMRSRLYKALKSKKDERTIDLVGCTIEKLEKWLEFTKKYYVPENYSGQIDIDHMFEFQHTDLTKKENLYRVANWKNLRYMTQNENICKSKKIVKLADIEKQQYLIMCFKTGRVPNEKYERMY